MERLAEYVTLRGENRSVRPEIAGRVRFLGACAFALTMACGQSEPSADAGSDGGADVRRAPDAAKCTVPEADGGTPIYRWSFDQHTILEDNGLIAPSPGSVQANGFDVDFSLACGVYFLSNVQQSLGNLDPFPPIPQRWRVSAWFRGTSDGTIFEFEGIRLTIQSGVLWVARNGATPPTYSTSLNAGDGAWHGVALQVDALATPLSIQVFVDTAQNQSPANLPWALDLTFFDLLIGGKVDPTAPENDFDEVSFFLYQ